MVQALREIIELNEFDEASFREASSLFRCADPEEASSQDVMRFLTEDAVDMERRGTTRTYLILNDERWAEGEVRIDGYFSIALKVLFFSKDIDAGLLEEIFPVMADVKKVPPNSHHHLDLFHHSVETVRQINEIYESSPVEVKEHLERVDFGGLPRIAHLKLAGFLHDIGKFSTWTIEQDTGRHRFIKHDDVGSKMALKILKDMHFSNKQVDYITLMIKNHIYPSHVMCSPTDKTMMRFVRKTGDNSVDNIVLAMADRLSARGPEITEDIVQNNILSLKRLTEFYFSVRETLKPLPKLLDGNQVMKILKIKPSPLLGEIMDALHDAQFDGSVVSKEDAVDFVKNFYHSLS